MFFEGTLVRAALGRMLSVDERIIFLSVLSRVGKGYFYVFPFQVDDRIKPVVGHIIVQQVYQTVAGMDAAAVEHDGQSRVQVCVVAQHRFNEFGAERVVLEQSTVRFEIDESSVFVGCRFRRFAGQDSAFESGPAHFAVAMASHFEVRAERVDRFHTHSVQSHALLECLGIVFAARVEHAHRFDEFAQRDTAAIVAYADPQVVLYGDFYPSAGIHFKLVDAVVYHFFQKHVDTVFGMRTVAQFSDVHARTGTDMFHVRQVADMVFGVFGKYRCFVWFLFFCHSVFLFK